MAINRRNEFTSYWSIQFSIAWRRNECYGAGAILLQRRPIPADNPGGGSLWESGKYPGCRTGSFWGDNHAVSLPFQRWASLWSTFSRTIAVMMRRKRKETRRTEKKEKNFKRLILTANDESCITENFPVGLVRIKVGRKSNLKIVEIACWMPPLPKHQTLDSSQLWALVNSYSTRNILLTSTSYIHFTSNSWSGSSSSTPNPTLGNSLITIRRYTNK